MAHGAQTAGSPLPRRRRIAGRPATRKGRRAAWLVAGGLALVPLAALLSLAHVPSAVAGPLGLLGLLTAVAGGVLAIVAVVRHGERSIAVFAALLVGLYAAFFVIGETISIFVEAMHH